MPATNTMFIQIAGSSELSLQQTNFDYGVGVLLGRLPLYTGNVVGSLFLSAFNQIGHVVGQVTGQIQSTAGMIINLLTSFLPNSPVPPPGGGPGNVPAYVWIPLTVPENALSMSFDFMLQGIGNADSFQVALNATNVLSLETSLIQTNVALNSGLIDVSQYAGQQVELFLGIVGGTSTNASLTVSNFQFYVALPPTLQAQVSGNSVFVSWPLSASDYVLETSNNLAVTNSWAAVTNVPAIVDFQNSVKNSISGDSRL